MADLLQRSWTSCHITKLRLALAPALIAKTFVKQPTHDPIKCFRSMGGMCALIDERARSNIACRLLTPALIGETLLWNTEGLHGTSLNSQIKLKAINTATLQRIWGLKFWVHRVHSNLPSILHAPIQQYHISHLVTNNYAYLAWWLMPIIENKQSGCSFISVLSCSTDQIVVVDR